MGGKNQKTHHSLGGEERCRFFCGLIGFGILFEAIAWQEEQADGDPSS